MKSINEMKPNETMRFRFAIATHEAIAGKYPTAGRSGEDAERVLAIRWATLAHEARLWKKWPGKPGDLMPYLYNPGPGFKSRFGSMSHGDARAVASAVNKIAKTYWGKVLQASPLALARQELVRSAARLAAGLIEDAHLRQNEEGEETFDPDCVISDFAARWVDAAKKSHLLRAEEAWPGSTSIAFEYLKPKSEEDRWRPGLNLASDELAREAAQEANRIASLIWEDIRSSGGTVQRLRPKAVGA